MFNVDKSKCIACGQCIKDCPTATISFVDDKADINNDRCMKCGHCIAICPVNAVSTDDYDMNQVVSYDKDTFSIDADNLLNFIKFRRSVRRFKDKEVEREKIEKIIEAGRYTQTSTNNQDVSYIVLTEKLGEFKELAYKCLQAKGEAILANMTPETEYLRGYATLWVNMYNAYKEDPINKDRLFFNAPAAIFVASNTPLNGGLASSNMELMVDALGLGTYFNGFAMLALQDNKEILDLLGLESSKSLISCLVIGYPNVTYKRTTPRKEVQVKWL